MILRRKAGRILRGSVIPLILAGVLAAGPSLGVMATSVDALRRRSNSTKSQLSAAQSETKALQNQEQQISEELVVSIGTVKTHVHNIFQKVDVKKREELLRCFEEFDPQEEE